MRGSSALLVLALAACGHGGGPAAAPSTTPPTPPPVSPTHVTEADVGQALRDAATAEESYYSDHGTYTMSAAALAEQGLTTKAPIRVNVLSASKAGYCLQGSGNGITLYYSTAGGQISATRCT